MTKDDKVAYNYARERLDNDDYPVYSDEYELECAFKAGIEYANRWISVEDELPKIEEANCEWVGSEDVLALLWNGDMSVGRYERDNISGEYYWTLYNVDKDHQVTHWMPLPEPPERISNKTVCPECFVAQYPPCGKGIPCCKCHEEDCNSRQPCPKKGGGE